MQKIKKYWRMILVGSVALANIFIWYIVVCETPSKYLKVVFLNIGQGDAIYIESPIHNRMLVDGGPAHSLLPELRKVLPFYVRSLDAFLNTNPDADHYAGMLDVFPTFHVGQIFEAGTKSDTPTYAEFEKVIKEKNIPDMFVRRDMIVHLGSGADLKILFPDQDVSTWSTNDGSVVAKLIYGNTSVMLTGDAPSKTEEYVLSLEGTSTKSTILKAGHHGSKTSASESFVSAVNPQYAIVSAGLHNKYGHPSSETVDLFHKLGIPMLVTFEKGRITATSDGTVFVIKTEK